MEQNLPLEQKQKLAKQFSKARLLFLIFLGWICAGIPFFTITLAVYLPLDNLAILMKFIWGFSLGILLGLYGYLIYLRYSLRCPNCQVFIGTNKKLKPGKKPAKFPISEILLSHGVWSVPEKCYNCQVKFR